MHKILLTTLISSISAAVFAGPLGFQKAMTLEEVNKIGHFVEFQPHIFKSDNIKNGIVDLETTTVLVTPQTGLCKVQETSKNIDTDTRGEELKKQYIKVGLQLKSQYGASTKYVDTVRISSPLFDPSHFMESLKIKDRMLTAFWFNNQDGLKLPDSLSTITIEGKSINAKTGYLTISYEFDNLSECMKIIKKN